MMYDIARAEALNNFFGNLLEAKKAGMSESITELAEEVVLEIINELSIPLPEKTLSLFSTDALQKEIEQRTMNMSG